MRTAWQLRRPNADGDAEVVQFAGAAGRFGKDAKRIVRGGWKKAGPWSPRVRQPGRLKGRMSAMSGGRSDEPESRPTEIIQRPESPQQVHRPHMWPSPS